MKRQARQESLRPSDQSAHTASARRAEFDAALRPLGIGPRLKDQPAWLGYGGALIAVLLVAFGRYSLNSVLGTQAPLLPFILAVLAAAYLGGLRPALLATLLSPLLCTTLFADWSGWEERGPWLAHVALFICVGGLVSWIVHELQVSHRQQRERSERLALLSDAAAALLAADEPTAFLDRIYGRLAALLGLEIYLHYSLSPDRTQLELSAYHGLADEHQRRVARLRLGEGVCGRVAATGAPEVVENLRASIDERTAMIRSVGITAYACYPLIARARLVGTLSFGTRLSERFDAASLALIRAISEQVATAIDRKRIRDALYASAQQIAERERRVRETEQRLGVLAETVPALIFIADGTQGGNIYTNSRFQRYAGLSADELLGLGWLAVIHPDDRERAAATWNTSWRTGRDYVAQYRFRNALGEYRWHVVRGSPVRDGRGQVLQWVGTGTDIQDLAETRDRLQLALSSIEDQFYLLDGHWCYVLANPRVIEVAGRPENGLFGRSVFEVFPELSNTRFEEELRAVARERSPRRFEFEYTASGRWFENSIYPAGEGVAVLATDITDRKRAEEALRQAEASLREADQRKDQFLATLAHELRNPLAPIRYAVKLLTPETPPATQLRAREMIERQSAQLARLLDDLLDVSRITRNIIELRRELLDLRDIAKEAIAAAQPVIDGMRHELQLTLSGEPLWVDGDSTRLHQIIDNLLHNATKYTDPGGRIEVAASRKGDRVVLTVHDSGIGLPPESIHHVFDLFTQVRHDGRAHGGLGIGLAVVKGLIELHGGSIAAESPGLGQGSLFRVELPSAEPREQATDESCGTSDNVVSLFRSGARILLVDDNPDVTESLALLLRGHGYSVHTSEDGTSAMRIAEVLQPDFIVLDLGMPDPDGYTVARWTRQQPWGVHARIVAVTGWGQPEDRRRTHEAGFDAHLVKPVEADDLLQVVARMTDDCAPAGSQH
jgi:PAS domain S-box-containing protein